jgi:hypothetical protein|tara:strand:- start:83 stop:517 length:435 start_codon:yes stop_codon:yes gene_type:complete
MDIIFRNDGLGLCGVNRNGVEVEFCYESVNGSWKLTKDSALRALNLGIWNRLEDTLNGSTEYIDEDQEEETAKKYDVYFKDFSGCDEADVYQVHHNFNLVDPSGCKHHASKKILLSGVRTGGKGEYKDMEEARDTINRWLEINK